MMTRRMIWAFIAIVGFVALVATVAYAISPQARLARNAAMGLADTTPIAWVNEQSINRGVLEGLANTISDQKGSMPDEAYQEAFNLLVQNTLIKEIAAQEGIATTDQEVTERVQALLADAKENSSLRATYVAQAQELGVTWDSPEFETFLKQQWSIALPVEKWNARLSEQAQGDTQKYREEKVRLLAEMLSSAAIRLDESALPENAKAIHVPDVSELPAAKETQTPTESTP